MTDENGWMPIESAPRDGTQILAYGAREKTYAAVEWHETADGTAVWELGHEWRQEADRFVRTGYGCGMTLTHWRYLPTPPEEG